MIPNSLARAKTMAEKTHWLSFGEHKWLSFA
jgi:hypothetical protein